MPRPRSVCRFRSAGDRSPACISLPPATDDSSFSLRLAYEQAKARRHRVVCRQVSAALRRSSGSRSGSTGRSGCDRSSSACTIPHRAPIPPFEAAHIRSFGFPPALVDDPLVDIARHVEHAIGTDADCEPRWGRVDRGARARRPASAGRSTWLRRGRCRACRCCTPGIRANTRRGTEAAPDLRRRGSTRSPCTPLSGAGARFSCRDPVDGDHRFDPDMIGPLEAVDAEVLRSGVPMHRPFGPNSAHQSFSGCFRSTGRRQNCSIHGHQSPFTSTMSDGQKDGSPATASSRWPRRRQRE